LRSAGLPEEITLSGRGRRSFVRCSVGEDAPGMGDEMGGRAHRRGGKGGKVGGSRKKFWGPCNVWCRGGSLMPGKGEISPELRKEKKRKNHPAKGEKDIRS